MTSYSTPLWWRLLNPIVTRRPPAAGSQPETVLSPLGVAAEALILNDDWADTARYRHIALRTTDGNRQALVELVPGPPGDDDHLVFLAHPNRLWVRTFRPPVVGQWLPQAPDDEVGEARDRRRQTITKARRR